MVSKGLRLKTQKMSKNFLYQENKKRELGKGFKRIGPIHYTKFVQWTVEKSLNSLEIQFCKAYKMSKNFQYQKKEDMLCTGI